MSQLASEIRSLGDESSTNYWSLGILTRLEQAPATFALRNVQPGSESDPVSDLSRPPASCSFWWQIHCSFTDKGNNSENSSEKNSEFFRASGFILEPA